MTKLLPATPLFEAARNRYLKILSPIFFPTNPFRHDIIRYISSLLRVGGLEARGWDPYAESRMLLEDLNVLMQIPLPEDRFPDDRVVWRLGLLFYNHVIEMSAPYEIIANLLRFRLEEGYSIDPFYKYLPEAKRKRYRKSGIFPQQKIEILSELGQRADVDIGSIFSDFVNIDIRNAVSHSDFIVHEKGIRCRKPYGPGSIDISFEELDKVLTNAKAFISAFLIIDEAARKAWGQHAGRAVPYDRHYKGLMEILVDDAGLLNGFKIHWPNEEESYYRRGDNGTDMVNCFLDDGRETIELFVGCYARQASSFSPLVEAGGTPRYSPLDGSKISPVWDYRAAEAQQKPMPEFVLQVSEADLLERSDDPPPESE